MALWGLPCVLGVQLQPSLLHLYLYLSSGGPQTPSLPPSHTNSAPAAPGSSRTAPRDRHGSSHRPQAQTQEISQVPRHPGVLPAHHCEQPHHPSPYQAQPASCPPYQGILPQSRTAPLPPAQLEQILQQGGTPLPPTFIARRCTGPQQHQSHLGTRPHVLQRAGSGRMGVFSGKSMAFLVKG